VPIADSSAQEFAFGWPVNGTEKESDGSAEGVQLPMGIEGTAPEACLDRYVARTRF
jgi:hypothetical protein